MREKFTKCSVGSVFFKHQSAERVWGCTEAPTVNKGSSQIRKGHKTQSVTVESRPGHGEV